MANIEHKVRAQSRPAVARTLAEAADEAKRYIHNSKAASTMRAYRSDFAHFETWCHEHGLVSLPAAPDTIALYLGAVANQYAPATLNRRLSAISFRHKSAGFETPTSFTHLVVDGTMKGIRREKGVRQEKKSPIKTTELKSLLRSVPAKLSGVRDRAVLMLGYTGAMRRSEIAQLDVRDLQWSQQGLTVTIRRSKTDQEGAGRSVTVPPGQYAATCAVTAVQEWLQAASIRKDAGAVPLFRAINRWGRVSERRMHPNSIGELVKSSVQRARLKDPEKYAGHSLRSGFATQVALNGATVFEIMAQTGHKSVAVCSGYVRDAQMFQETAARKLGL